MRQMKDSGIEWLGEIPEDWAISKLSNFYNFEKGKQAALYTKEYIAENVGIYPVYSGQTENDGIMGFVDSCDYDLEECLFTTTVGAKVMTLKILHGKFCLSQNCLIMKANNLCSNHFIFYFLNSLFDYEKSAIPSYMQPSLRISDLKKYNVCLPILDVQQKIANFLDDKCAKINSLIAHEEATIKELKAYKQSVITETVTKGLDPNAPIKDSGVEWIGSIPEGWSISSTKRLFRVESGATPKSDESVYWDGDISWITPADFKTDDKYVFKGRRNITEKGLQSCSAIMVPMNSLVFSKRAPIGAVCIAGQELCTNQGCLSCVSIRNIDIRFYYYVMSICKTQYELLGNGTTFKEISLSCFENFLLPIPSFTEQIQISDFLDCKCKTIDYLIAIKQKKIEKLNEYKKSLIYEYVTGKKEVA